MKTKKVLYHVIFIALIVLIGFFNIKEFWVYNESAYHEIFGTYYTRTQSLRYSMFDYGNFFPLWQPYFMSGTPFHDGVSVDVFSYMGVLNLILPDSFMVAGFTYILSYILIGVFMYFLGLYIFKDKKYAFISALVLMLGGYATSRFGEGTYQLCALSILPLAFMFLMKAIKEKDWVKNTIICGVLITIQIKVAPDMKVTLFTSLLFALYLFFQLIGKNIKARIVKVSLIGILLILVIFGLSAHYVLVQKEYISISSRAHNTWEKASSRKTPINRLFPAMVEPFHKNMFKIRHENENWPGMGYKIGIFAFILAAFAVFKKPKNKFILFLAATVILTISIAIGSFVFYLLWKYVPPWDSFRYVNRSYVLWSFSGALLAGFGAKYLMENLESRFKFDKRKLVIIFIVICVLIIANLALFIPHPIKRLGPRCSLSKLVEKADALHYMKDIKEKNNEIFRVHDWETTGIDWPTDPFTLALGLEHIFGYMSAWDQEYMNVYLSLAYRNPAKFWGILNVKYITSRSKINISNFRLVKEFPRFESDGKCPPPNQSTWNDPNADAAMKVFGQYLYENEEYLPRAYMVDNSALIVGKHENVMNFMYMLMLNPNFDPENTVIIHGKESINDYDMAELRKYTAVFLTEGSVDQNSGFLLKQYVDSGGILLPDIVNGQNQISEEDIANVLQLSKDDLDAIPDKDIITESFEKKIIKLDKPVKGFLVLSEKYSMFKGWKANIDDKRLELLRANGVVTATYIDNETGSIRFNYSPRSYKLGVTITLVTIFLLLCYWIFRRSKNRGTLKISR
jgi:hypothetical protein